VDGKDEPEPNVGNEMGKKPKESNYVKKEGVPDRDEEEEDHYGAHAGDRDEEEEDHYGPCKGDRDEDDDDDDN